MSHFQTENLWVNQLADGIADLVLDVPDSKVNVLSREVLADFERALDRVADDAQFRLLIVRTGKGASFCTGLAPRLLATLSPDDIRDISAQGQRIFQKLAQLRLATVAILSGGCLGGGLELALACDYRVAVQKPTTILGFPELELGLIPIWGGTQRLPRLVGLERGLQMLLGGRRLMAREAKKWGLVDEIAVEGSSVPPAFMSNPHKRTPVGLPLRTLRQKLTESTGLGRWLIFRGAERLLRNRLPDDMPAPWAALEAVRTGLRDGMEAGLARESAAAGELAATEAHRNLVTLHVERDKFRTAPPRREGRPRSVGIVGGSNRVIGLLYTVVTKGHRVVLRETSDSALGYALFQMLTVFQQEVARGAMAAADLMKNLGNIHGTTAWKGFEDVDLVLDASADDVEKKKSLFRELEAQTPAKALLVTTGSSATVEELQDGLKHPERVAGLHFQVPVRRSLLVEVAASSRTDPEVTKRVTDFVIALGRAPQRIKDAPGLLVERLLLPYFNEAILLVKEGYNPQRVDEAMVHFGMIHGPLEHMDVIGLDNLAALVGMLVPVFEPRLTFDETFDFMVEHQWLGQDAGLGFYRYRGKSQKVHAALVGYLRGSSHVGAPYRMDAVSRQDQMKRARHRLVWLMINEAAWCLEEERAESPQAFDLGLMLAGWAPHRGGPLQYGRHVGSATVIKHLEELAATHGPRYEPCPALERLLD